GRHLRAGAAGQLVAVHHREADVDEGHVGVEGGGGLEGGGAVVGDGGEVAAGDQALGEGVGRVAVVVDDEDPAGVGAGDRAEGRGDVPGAGGIRRSQRQLDHELAAPAGPVAAGG